MQDQPWSSHHAELLYNTHAWSEGYVSVNARGNVVIHPTAQTNQGVDLYEVIQALKSRHLKLPVLIRFTDILNHRVHKLHRGFSAAITAVNYRGEYTSLYPIKVNQQHSVVEELVKSEGGEVGLEAGSKAELMAVLGLIHRGGTIVCNGYKDKEYVRLALIGQKLGHRVFIVIEKLSELELVLQQARLMGVTPGIGIRVRLASIGAGNWQNSGGEKSKFGLTAKQILAVVARLKKQNHLHCLSMLHFHLGSQLVDIEDIKKGMQECARFYAELHALGATVKYVDVGGGLGVDYEGRNTTSACSMNYDINRYAGEIVTALYYVCAERNLPHPHIFTESGRAMTAHHAVLVTNVIDREVIADSEELVIDGNKIPAELQALWQIVLDISAEQDLEKIIKLYAVKNQQVQKLQARYNNGLLSLDVRAQMEDMALLVNRRVQAGLVTQPDRYAKVFDEINKKMADKYFCNFSLFQSVPDIWGIEQVFPIMPLHRLDERPRRRAVLEDITCDSDGRIDQFVEAGDIEASLLLHDFKKNDEYLIGIFMVGAYQEILGDMHNLFGDTDSVHVELDNEGNYHFRELIQGDTIDAVLNYVHINSDELVEKYRTKLAESDLEEEDKHQFLDELSSALHGYTYLEK